MTPEEINRRISTWAGLDSHVCDEWAFHCDDCERGSIQTPDYYGSNAAMDLLRVLESQEYWWEMGNCENGDKFIKIGSWHCGLIVTAQRPAISAAICHAIIELIEREGGLSHVP